MLNPLQNFAEHCCSVGNEFFEATEAPDSMKQRLQRSINMHLQGQRKKKDFVATEDQLKAYHSIRLRNTKKAL
jgi:hypothetical protein